MLVNQADVEIVTIKDYIKKPKENGYRSLHMIVLVDVYFSDHKDKVPIEIQFRTIAMNFWASTEHQLRYKKGIEDLPGYAEISEELLRSAQAVIETDNEMQQIKNKIGMFHDI